MPDPNNETKSDGVFDYLYDNEGNRTQRTEIATGAVTEYRWDYRNRLTRVTEKDTAGAITQVVEYTYDVFNRRIEKAVDTTSPFDLQDAALESYIYDDASGISSDAGGNVILDFVDADGPAGPGSSTLSTRRLYGAAVDQILAEENVAELITSPSRVLWNLVDNLGTTRDIARNDATLATHFTFDAFGQVLTGDTSLTRYLYTSREFDPATGLTYYRARWYATSLGQFISEDPTSFAAGDANLRRYVNNNATNATDPSGLAAKGWWARAKALAGRVGRRTNQFAGQVGVLAFTGDWVDPDMADGAKLAGGFVNDVGASFSDGRVSDSLQGGATEWVDQLADVGVASLNSFTGTIDNIGDFYVGGFGGIPSEGNPLYVDRDRDLGGRWIDMWDPYYGHVEEFEQSRAVGAHVFHAQLTVVEVAAAAELAFVVLPEAAAAASAFGAEAATALGGFLTGGGGGGAVFAGFGGLGGGGALSGGWVTAGSAIGAGAIPLAGAGAAGMIDWGPIGDVHFNYMANMRASRAGQSGVGSNAEERARNTTPSPALEGSPYHPNSVAARQTQWRQAYRKEFLRGDASNLGFTRRIAPQKAPFNSHGQEVFFDGKRYLYSRC